MPLRDQGRPGSSNATTAPPRPTIPIAHRRARLACSDPAPGLTRGSSSTPPPTGLGRHRRTGWWGRRDRRVRSDGAGCSTPRARSFRRGPGGSAGQRRYGGHARSCIGEPPASLHPENSPATVSWLALASRSSWPPGYIAVRSAPRPRRSSMWDAQHGVLDGPVEGSSNVGVATHDPMMVVGRIGLKQKTVSRRARSTAASTISGRLLRRLARASLAAWRPAQSSGAGRPGA